MNIVIGILSVIGLLTLVVIIIEFIIEIHDYYVYYKICKVNDYIHKYRSIIDRFIEVTSELHHKENLDKDKVIKMDLEIFKLIDEYEGVK